MATWFCIWGYGVPFAGLQGLHWVCIFIHCFFQSQIWKPRYFKQNFTNALKYNLKEADRLNIRDTGSLECPLCYFPHVSCRMGINRQDLPPPHNNLLGLQFPASNAMGYRSVGQKTEQQRMHRAHHGLAPYQGQSLEAVLVKECFIKNKRCYIYLKGYFMASVLPLSVLPIQVSLSASNYK